MNKPIKRERLVTSWELPFVLTPEQWEVLVDISKTSEVAEVVFLSPSSTQAVRVRLTLYNELEEE